LSEALWNIKQTPLYLDDDTSAGARGQFDPAATRHVRELRLEKDGRSAVIGLVGGPAGSQQFTLHRIPSAVPPNNGFYFRDQKLTVNQYFLQDAYGFQFSISCGI
jgi:hypothetical protein